jgi:hypothetical protein
MVVEPATVEACARLPELPDARAPVQREYGLNR